MKKFTKRLSLAAAPVLAVGMLTVGSSETASAAVWVCVAQDGISMCSNGTIMLIEPY